MGTIEKLWVLMWLPLLWFLHTELISDRVKWALIWFVSLYLCLTDTP